MLGSAFFLVLGSWCACTVAPRGAARSMRARGGAATAGAAPFASVSRVLGRSETGSASGTRKRLRRSAAAPLVKQHGHTRAYCGVTRCSVHGASPLQHNPANGWEKHCATYSGTMNGKKDAAAGLSNNASAGVAPPSALFWRTQQHPTGAWDAPLS